MAAFELRTAENVKSEAELLKKKERKKENDQEKEERSGKVNEWFFVFFNHAPITLKHHNAMHSTFE